MPMPITQLLQAMSGTCRYCNQPAGFLRKQHDQCRQTHQAGIQEITQLAAQAADASSFNETALRSTLQAIANRARATPPDRGRYKFVDLAGKRLPGSFSVLNRRVDQGIAASWTTSRPAA